MQRASVSNAYFSPTHDNMNTATRIGTCGITCCKVDTVKVFSFHVMATVSTLTAKLTTSNSPLKCVFPRGVATGVYRYIPPRNKKSGYLKDFNVFLKIFNVLNIYIPIIYPPPIKFQATPLVFPLT